PRRGDPGSRPPRDRQDLHRILQALRRLVPRASHAPGGREALRVVPSPRAGRMDGEARAPALRGDRVAHPLARAQRLARDAHRAHLRSRFLRRPDARPPMTAPLPDLTSVVRPGDAILVGQAGAEPQTLVEALVAQREALTGCRVFLGINYSGIVKAAHADHLRLSSYGGIGHNRALADAGVLDIVPAP